MKLEEVKKPDRSGLYTLKEVAEFMGVSYETAQKLVKSGKINAVNLAMTGKKSLWRIRAEDVQKYYNQIQIAINRSKGID